MLNENTIKGKWLEIRGDVQKAWGRLTNDELDQTKGDLKALGGLIQQRYGEAQDATSKKLAAIYARFEEKLAPAAEPMKESVKH